MPQFGDGAVVHPAGEVGGVQADARVDDGVGIGERLHAPAGVQGDPRCYNQPHVGLSCPVEQRADIFGSELVYVRVPVDQHGRIVDDAG